jgi:hypothetical protein
MNQSPTWFPIRDKAEFMPGLTFRVLLSDLTRTVWLLVVFP